METWLQPKIAPQLYKAHANYARGVLVYLCACTLKSMAINRGR